MMLRLNWETSGLKLTLFNKSVSSKKFSKKILNQESEVSVVFSSLTNTFVF